MPRAHIYIVYSHCIYSIYPYKPGACTVRGPLGILYSKTFPPCERICAMCTAGSINQCKTPSPPSSIRLSCDCLRRVAQYTLRDQTDVIYTYKYSPHIWWRTHAILILITLVEHCQPLYMQIYGTMRRWCSRICALWTIMCEYVCVVGHHFQRRVRDVPTQIIHELTRNHIAHTTLGRRQLHHILYISGTHWEMVLLVWRGDVACYAALAALIGKT